MTYDFSVWFYAFPYMLAGAVTTLEISALAMVAGSVIGLLCGLLSQSGLAPVRWTIRGYVYFVRGTPALPRSRRLGLSGGERGLRITALDLDDRERIVKVVRAGLQSIERGQTEAAQSIGMTNRQTLLYILLPQSLRVITPPVTNELITLVKSSSLLSVISVFELTRATQVIIAERFTPFELYLLLAIFYLVMVSVLSYVSEFIEARLA